MTTSTLTLVQVRGTPWTDEPVAIVGLAVVGDFSGKEHFEFRVGHRILVSGPLAPWILDTAMSAHAYEQFTAGVRSGLRYALQREKLLIAGSALETLLWDHDGDGAKKLEHEAWVFTAEPTKHTTRKVWRMGSDGGIFVGEVREVSSLGESRLIAQVSSDSEAAAVALLGQVRDRDA